MAVGLSGCLGDDIWREPFDWNESLSIGENLDGAQALAAAVEGLAPQSLEEVGEVFETVDDLPNNVVFQNLREFLERQSPGAGDQVDDTIRLATGTANGTYVTLAGELAAAYEQVAGPLGGSREPILFEVADRATSIRYVFSTVLAQESAERGQNPTPLGTVEMVLRDPDGHERARWLVDTTREIRDQFVVGTYGGRNEVREDLGGTWSVEVSASGEGSWALVIDAREPRYDDYEFWQFWRAERKETLA